MCGRYLIWEMAEVKDYFLLKEDSAKNLQPRYNAAPGQDLPVIIRDGDNRLSTMRWGLIPAWAKDSLVGYRLINARSESVFDKPTWRQAIFRRRCLVPSNGFYEWQRDEDVKQPFLIRPKDRGLFAFAGLYDRWTDKSSGELIDSFSILTTAPNREMSAIHDRMPLILPRAAEQAWLDPQLAGAERLSGYLRPYADGSLSIIPVGSAVNNAANDYPELVKPLPVDN